MLAYGALGQPPEDCLPPTSHKGIRDLNLRSQGARRLSGGQWEFVLWAPFQREVTLHVLEPQESRVPMQSETCGYYSAIVEHLEPGSTYSYELHEGRNLPDPASRSQPLGVHGPSQVADPESFIWSDHAWKGQDLSSSIFYELHVGTYTHAGTFDAIIPRLDGLVDLGVTTIELMPIAQFPGGHNWGYDGVYPFAVQNTYGGHRGLQRLVDAAHARGLAVALDLVYNHLGPEGNYLGVYGSYFSSRYKTPWGEAINFDGPDSDPVRRFFIDNALYWVEHFHIDALRLDAVHGIFDFGANPILAELQSEVQSAAQRLGRPIPVIAESNLNDVKLMHPKEKGGYGLDGQWSDDFHHSVHTLLTGELAGYYADFGKLSNLTDTLEAGWCYTGQYSVFRRRRHGNSPAGLRHSQFVVCTQNHDQIGNRAHGERLTALVDLEAQKLAAGITLLSPFTPLLFMGEEYGETSPFQYFVSHGDQDLIEAVRRGRHEEFSSFAWVQEVPDPQADSTFELSHLDHARRTREPHSTILRFYKYLIQFRKDHSLNQREDWEIRELGDRVILALLGSGPQSLSFVFHFGNAPITIEMELPGKSWRLCLDSSDTAWLGVGSSLPQIVYSNPASAITLQPWSFAVLERAAES
jgi:maltooligosyltrehalose trehalohydrolase